jgi:hypothetical protein
MANKFSNYFKKSLTLKEADLSLDPAAQEDQEVFNQSFEDPQGAEQVEAELQNASISPEQKMAMMQKADMYAEKISNNILPMLRKLHDSIVSGEFKDIAPDLKGVSDITGKLAELSENLRGKVRDSILKANQNDAKNAK